MAKQESRSDFRFTGQHEDERAVPVEKTPTPPTSDFAKQVALGVLESSRGRLRTVPHCKQRMRERNFDVFDVNYVIRNGRCIEEGAYCEQYNDFKYKFNGDIDGLGLDVAFALCAEHDLLVCPILILITGCWKNKTGRRSQSF